MSKQTYNVGDKVKINATSWPWRESIGRMGLVEYLHDGGRLLMVSVPGVGMFGIWPDQIEPVTPTTNPDSIADATEEDLKAESERLEAVTKVAWNTVDRRDIAAKTAALKLQEAEEIAQVASYASGAARTKYNQFRKENHFRKQENVF